jgi:hypothetical protein
MNYKYYNKFSTVAILVQSTSQLQFNINIKKHT